MIKRSNRLRSLPRQRLRHPSIPRLLEHVDALETEVAAAYGALSLPTSELREHLARLVN